MADQEDAPAAPVALFKKRGAKAKANIRKRPATPPPADSDDSDFSSSEDESGRRIKRRKKTVSAVVTASSKNAPPLSSTDLAATVFSADRDVTLDSSKRDATKGAEWFDEDKQFSTRDLLGKTRELPEGTYKGLKNQTSFIERNPDAPRRTVGPVKAPTNIRTITITDMAPDVCKD